MKEKERYLLLELPTLVHNKKQMRFIQESLHES